DGQILLESLAARSGPTRVEVTNLRLHDLRADTDLDGRLRVEHLTLSPGLFDRLPAGLHDIPRLFAPEGTASFTIDLRRREGKWSEHCVVEPENVTVCYEKFPYRLVQVTGTITHEMEEGNPGK